MKNYPLPKNRSLIPLFEAITNSLHAIEERDKEDPNYSKGYIKIEVIRDRQFQPELFSATELAPVDGFIISDNGIGFTDPNMRSFLESDSEYKASLGGKGVGRFSWLKAFPTATICSIYMDNGSFVKREFEFSLSNQQVDDTPIECPTATDCLTIITLESYSQEYVQDVPKQIETIALKIVQHLLIYFLDPRCPRITITDNNEVMDLNDLFKRKFRTEENTIQLLIDSVNFNLLHMKIEEKTFKGNRLHLCACNRLVYSKDLLKLIADLDKQIFERNGFWYIGVLTSDYFNTHVDMNRLSFNIPEKASESDSNIFEGLSMEIITHNACTEIEKYLAEYLSPIAEEKKRRIEKFIIKKAPQYRHLLKYMSEEISGIKPNLSDEKLEDELYSIKREFDKKAKSEQNKLFEEMANRLMSTEEYEDYFKKQIKKISEANSAALADYVAHRRVVIDLLEYGLRRNEDGKFNKEKHMHDLIYPRGVISDDLSYEAHNLWLIDEKLSYCCYIASDVPFDNDPKQERSDILVLDNPVAVSDNGNDGTEFDTIILFELKRPMREDYSDSNNPITQLYKYLEKIRNGKAKDRYHRIIGVGETTKFYLYAVCDITSKMKPLINQYNFSPTPDRMGYYSYNDQYNAYFEILSYDKILHNAKKRNRVFFDKLGIEPIRQ